MKRLRKFISLTCSNCNSALDVGATRLLLFQGGEWKRAALSVQTEYNVSTVFFCCRHPSGRRIAIQLTRSPLRAANEYFIRLIDKGRVRVPLRNRLAPFFLFFFAPPGARRTSGRVMNEISACRPLLCFSFGPSKKKKWKLIGQSHKRPDASTDQILKRFFCFPLRAVHIERKKKFRNRPDITLAQRTAKS